ncbi:MAG: PEP-CTERM sorting domain-containing protein [Opitutales bacterium]|nr:PEP-CTERM sorting domain-containing protein [Opitutales bacterium]
MGAAIIVVEEDFTGYANNTQLDGTAAQGSGLTGDWSVAGASEGVRSFTGTISYSAFDAVGTVSGGHARPGNHWQSPTLSGDMATSVSEDVFVQYLFRIPSLPTDTSNTDIGIRMNIGSSGLGFYIPGTTAGSNGEGNIFVGGGWGGANSANFTFSTNTAYMLLGKLEHDGNNYTKASLWLNPVGSEYEDITGSAASVTGIDISGMALSSLSEISFSWNDRRAGSGSPELGNVTVIPEPRTYAAVFGLMALGLILWRRRR